MDPKSKNKIGFRFMLALTLVVGIVGIGLQFAAAFEFFTFFLGLPVLGSLIGGSQGYSDFEHRQLDSCYKPTIEWMLLILLVAYGFILLSRSVPAFGPAAGFINGHWPGLVLSILCIMIGVAGLRFKKSTAS